LSSNHNSHSSHSKRNVDIVVISDVHLGTAACRATQLLAYLKSINPGKLVLNGDIIDMQQFDHRYWPASHTKVVRRILKFTTIGIPVFYVTGNHEQALRPYSSMLFDFGLLHLVDRLEWTIDGRRTLIAYDYTHLFNKLNPIIISLNRMSPVQTVCGPGSPSDFLARNPPMRAMSLTMVLSDCISFGGFFR